MESPKRGKSPKLAPRRRTHQGESDRSLLRIKEELARSETADEIVEAEAWHASLPEYLPITNDLEVHHVIFLTKRVTPKESTTARSGGNGRKREREIEKERPAKDWYSLADVQNDNAFLRAIIKDLIREPVLGDQPG